MTEGTAIPQADGDSGAPQCPDCGSEKLIVVHGQWIVCNACDSSFTVDRDLLIAAALESHRRRNA